MSSTIGYYNARSSARSFSFSSPDKFRRSKNNLLVKISLAKKAQKFIQDAEDRCTNQNISFTTKIIYGYDPAYDIEQFTKKYKHDMIVIGAKGKSILKRIFLGSVSSYVVQTSKTPVTVIKWLSDIELPKE